MSHIEKIREIRSRLMMRAITYEQARAEASPVIDEMNEKAAEIAKRFGRKHRRFSFPVLMRSA